MSELKPCPMCGGAPNKPAKNGGSDERSGYNFTVTVACKCGLRIDRASHQGKQGWCDDSGQAEAEAIAAWNRRAQPAAPAAYLTDCPKSESAIDAERTKAREDMRLYGMGFTVNGWHVPAPLVSICNSPDAAPSVAPEPVAWTLQSELDAAQTTCSAHLWFTNPRNSAWTALFTREQIAANPPRAPLTRDEIRSIFMAHGFTIKEGCDDLKEYVYEAARALEQAHGIGGK